MKKTFYILIAALLCAMSCQRENVQNFGMTTTKEAPSPGTLVSVEFGVQYPDAAPETRAPMGEAVSISKLYIAIFSEEGGYLQNWIPATFVRNDNPEPGMKVTYTYKAYLPLTDNKIFHFIADPPIDQPTFDYEQDFIQTMVTTGNTGAYWQRVIIDGGVQPLMEEGEYVLVNGNYTVDPSSITNMQHVVMVRNFAKIEVSSADTRFTVSQWGLVNVPKSGTIAPWNRKKTGEGDEEHIIGFDNPYTHIKEYLPETSGGAGLHKLGKFYEDLTQKQLTGYMGYVGTMPEGVEFTDETTVPTLVSASASDNGLYMYERPVPNSEQDPTMILIQIHWIDSDEYPGKDSNLGQNQWYKIELLDNEGEYMPILRNIVYHFALSGLSEGGYATATAALGGNAFGNVSSSLETSMLNELIVGDTKLVVDHLDQSFYNNETSGQIEFQFWPSLTADPVFNSATFESEEDKNITIKIYSKQVDGYEDAPAIETLNLSGVTETVERYGENWGVIPITLKAPLEDGGMRKSIVRIQGAYGLNRAIYREVMITVMGKQSFTSGTPDTITISDAVDQTVTIPICLPAGLGSSMFPIQIAIEAENNCLSSTESKLPVKDDVSIFDAGESSKAGKNTFYYIRTIQYSEYHPVGATADVTTFNCNFKTTKTSGNSTRIKLMDLTGKYNSKIITLTAN